MDGQTLIKTIFGFQVTKVLNKISQKYSAANVKWETCSILWTSKSSNIKSYIINNGSDCPSSHSFNWRKANKYWLSTQGTEEPNKTQNSSLINWSWKTCSYSSNVWKKKRQDKGRFENCFFIHIKVSKSIHYVSPSEELNQRTFSGPSNLGKFFKGTLLGRMLYSSVSAPESPLNGFYGNPLNFNSMQRPRANSCAPRSSFRKSLARSSDNIIHITSDKNGKVPQLFTFHSEFISCTFIYNQITLLH